ncbi:putative peptidyl-tRNA hydrolase PTRHD1 isoform X2 [Gallus gallus]|uniref:putative peptidyl-tRNA hydrolase PTRHD1 isoform X2 n=1 Tax=Gallus gallus TaxID=9031 RepID=UPI001F018583|nr:putative peptidyl-tRNA hydrolase PTRHD1 isoform X2 [Gallus gallus]XP_046795386.1 putative peptidyl-tRNA hydrolase PTRHD1 isoform X2 [Gallus gallus]
MRGHASPYSNMAAPGTAAGAATATALVQYVVLRGDLARSWSLGAVVAQGCHAALAAAHAHWHHPDTRAYLSAGGAMRTVVLENHAANPCQEPCEQQTAPSASEPGLPLPKPKNTCWGLPNSGM